MTARRALARLLTHLDRLLGPPLCPICRQPLDQCRRDEPWHDHY